MSRQGDRADRPADPERQVGVVGAVRRGASAASQVLGERLSTDDPELLHPGERFAGMEVSYEEFRDVTGRLADLRFRASVVAADRTLAASADLGVPERFVPAVEAREVRETAADARGMITALRADGRRNRERLAALGGDVDALPGIDGESLAETVDDLEALAEVQTVEPDRVADVFGDALDLLYDSADVRRTEARRPQAAGAGMIDVDARDGAGEDQAVEQGEAAAQAEAESAERDAADRPRSTAAEDRTSAEDPGLGEALDDSLSSDEGEDRDGGEEEDEQWTA